MFVKPASELTEGTHRELEEAMSEMPGDRLEREARSKRKTRTIRLKRRRSPERVPDLALRQVVIKAKREGTLGHGSR
jgi:hypothetical protein